MNRIYCLAIVSTIWLLSCRDKQPSSVIQDAPTYMDTMPLDSPRLVNNMVYPGVDISPMDMSYYPVDFPKQKINNSLMAAPFARVVYSRPHLGKRKLFPDIIKYDKPWRLGANEATEIDFFKPATIQDVKVNTGRYILYCIPHENEWTLVLNSNIDSWGLNQDSTKDVHHFVVPVSRSNISLQYFSIIFEEANKGANLVIAWDNAFAKLPIAFR